jgi:hypothetical protein
MRFPAAVVYAALSVFLLGACGGSKGDTPPTSTTEAVTPTTVDEGAADRATAVPVLIASSDLPPNVWIATAPQDEDQDSMQTSGQINTCLGIASPAEIQVVKVKGNDFRNGNNTIGSDVIAFNSATVASQYATGLVDPKQFGCISAVLDEALANALGGTFSATSTYTALSGITTNNSQFAARLTTTTGGSPSRKIYSDMVGMRSGRFVASANLTYLDNPPPAQLTKAVLAALTQRLSAANTR